MNLINYLKNIRQKGERSFTLSQIMADLNLSKNAALNAIHRLKMQSDLMSPARGLYVIVPPEHQSYGSIPANELVPILMEYLQVDYYASLLTAAQYYGASHQKPHIFQIVSNKRTKYPLEFGQVKIEIIYKKSLANLPVKNVVVKTGYLKIATPELTAMDLFLYPKKSGGLDHIATVLSELVEALDADKLIELAKISGGVLWLQRLGYVLEKIEPMDIDATTIIIQKLEEYLAHTKHSFIPLTPELPKTGCSRSKKWMIIENTTIESDL